ncbi:hypothetical protein OAO01_06725 [Oligoflexia bacterium]|nr:hypothetical protein [Oligoflexia bacterium]
MEKLIKYGIYSTLVCLCSVIACGGGGGGGNVEFVGAGVVSLSVSPTTVDVGDRMLVTVKLEKVSEDGVIVKVNYPDGLEYVLNSALLTVDGDELDIGPAVNALSGNNVFLVYFFGLDLFGDDMTGTLTFQLEGTEKVSSGDIEVDIDVDDPLIANANEFDLDNPEFQVEAAVGVSVES